MEKTEKRILIIDDDEYLLMCTRELLENEGYRVFVHNSGFGVASIVKLVHPDLVLLDMNMPGLSGQDIASRLQRDKETKDVPLVLYSSNDELCLREVVRRLGLPGYICKGDIPGLKQMVSLYLGPA